MFKYKTWKIKKGFTMGNEAAILVSEVTQAILTYMEY